MKRTTKLNGRRCFVKVWQKIKGSSGTPSVGVIGFRIVAHGIVGYVGTAMIGGNGIVEDVMSALMVFPFRANGVVASRAPTTTCSMTGSRLIPSSLRLWPHPSLGGHKSLCL